MEERKRRRTTQQVKDDIMQAVGNVLEKQGANKLGVETVAAEAGMDKAMLYRHYKDFNDILRTYVEQEDFWLKLLSVKEYAQVNKDNLVDIVNNIFTNQFNKLFKNNKFQQLLIWELSDTSGLMKDAAQKREDMAVDILNGIKNFFPYKNILSDNIMAIISAGIYYLVLHRNISTFATIDLNDNEHKEKFISDLLWLVERVFSPISETDRIVLNCIKKGLENELISEITGIDSKRINELRELK